MTIRSSVRRLAFALAIAVLVPAFAAAQDAAAAPAPAKVHRWESNLSGGSVSNGRIGLVKSFWWYPLPKYVAIGLSFDYVYEAMPLSVCVALNAPTPVVVPFVCAGAGGTLTAGRPVLLRRRPQDPHQEAVRPHRRIPQIHLPARLEQQPSGVGNGQGRLLRRRHRLDLLTAGAAQRSFAGRGIIGT